MGKAAWKQRQREGLPPSPVESRVEITYLQGLKYAVTIFAKKYFPLLLPFLLLSALMAILKLFILPDINWTIFQLNNFTQHLDYKQLLDPNYVLTPAEYNVVSMGNQLITYIDIFVAILDAIPQYFGILMTAGVIKQACDQIINPDKMKLPVSLGNSIARPFRGGKAAIAIIAVLILSVLVPLGLSFLLVPGFLVLVFLIFILQVVALEDLSSLHVFRVAYRHTKDQKLKILLTVLLGFVVTYPWNYLVGLIFPPLDWSVFNPANRPWEYILLYYLANQLMIALVLPFVSCLYTMLYLQIQHAPGKLPTGEVLTKIPVPEEPPLKSRKAQKVRYCPYCSGIIKLNARVCPHCNEKLPETPVTEVIPKRSRRTQQMRYCPHCARAIPASSRICPHCKKPLT
ncbi:MAG TPA: zinc ribbon domain-containing protein [Candidatus Lokiarchaeia archaeon]|nr:zinc ribbon domain-containing protein [Candidatus Lokiarchaeia archaeon]